MKVVSGSWPPLRELRLAMGWLAARGVFSERAMWLLAGGLAAGGGFQLLPVVPMACCLSVGGGLLLARFVARLERGPALQAIILGSYILRVFLAVLLFGVSFWRLPVLPALQSGGGFWAFGADSGAYHHYGALMAKAWMHGTELPDPGIGLEYFLLVGLVYRLFGSHPLYPLVLNCWLAAVNALLAYQIGRKLFDRRAARLGATLVGFWPSSLIWSGQLLKDTLSWFLISAAVWCVLAAILRAQRARERVSLTPLSIAWIGMTVAGVTRLRFYLGSALSFAAMSVLVPAGLLALWRRQRGRAAAYGVMIVTMAASTVLARTIDVLPIVSPTRPEAGHYGLAIWHWRKEQLTDAEEEFNKGIAAKPHSQRCHEGVAMLRVVTGRINEASAAYAAYLERTAPDDRRASAEAIIRQVERRIQELPPQQRVARRIAGQVGSVFVTARKDAQAEQEATARQDALPPDAVLAVTLRRPPPTAELRVQPPRLSVAHTPQPPPAPAEATPMFGPTALAAVPFLDPSTQPRASLPEDENVPKLEASLRGSDVAVEAPASGAGQVDGEPGQAGLSTEAGAMQDHSPVGLLGDLTAPHRKTAFKTEGSSLEARTPLEPRTLSPEPERPSRILIGALSLSDPAPASSPASVASAEPPAMTGSAPLDAVSITRQMTPAVVEARSAQAQRLEGMPEALSAASVVRRATRWQGVDTLADRVSSIRAAIGRFIRRMNDEVIFTAKETTPELLQVRREGFVSSGGYSLTNPGAQISSVGKLASHLPQALAVGFLAPFPRQWFDTGGSTGVMRALACVEMLMLYVVLLGVLFGVRPMTRARPVAGTFLLTFVVALAVPISLVVANLGTLFRLRLQFLLPLLIIGGGGLQIACEWSRAWGGRWFGRRSRGAPGASQRAEPSGQGPSAIEALEPLAPAASEERNRWARR